jgi:8-oxo-dGTP pyrophosphatase MutT (NUDIX family)
MSNKNELFLRLIQLLNSMPKDILGSIPFSSGGRYRLAAVLVIIHYKYMANNDEDNDDDYKNDDDNNKIPHLLLTKRSSRITSHANEISFPGGSFDKSDASLADTAIRETKEEIGLHFQKSDLMGHLTAVRTLTSNFIIYPFVTLQDKKTLTPTILTDEVQDIIDAPLLETLQTMDKDYNYNYSYYYYPHYHHLYRHHHYSSLEDAYKFTYRNEVIWGATARILKQLHDILSNNII